MGIKGNRIMIKSDETGCGLFLLGILIGIAIGGTLMISKFEKESVKLGHAEYNQSTGDWQWKEAGSE